MRKHRAMGITLPEDVVSLEEYYKRANTKFCVLSMRNGKEHKSPWFYSNQRAGQARDIIIGKGFPAVIYVD